MKTCYLFLLVLALLLHPDPGVAAFFEKIPCISLYGTCAKTCENGEIIDKSCDPGFHCCAS